MTLLATAGAAALAPSPALANPFGSVCDNAYDCVSMANNPDHAIRFQNLSDPDDYWNGIPGAAVAANHAISQLNRTDMTVYRNESDSLPDVWVHDFDYGASGWLGIARCPANNTGTGGSHPNRWCRGQNIIMNSWYYWNTTYLDTEFTRRVLACHELGHTVGLQHSDDTNSCMYTYPRSATGSILQAHDIAHVNARY
ncbi:matrixin family metalloprotease [Actinoplanes sp. NBC_00393]|uniref:matrixin family metalloprotease n=1 Tax=Actinoplanes sp. NBC_00393 TaxID=2975953 RepID=UPI002E1BDA79